MYRPQLAMELNSCRRMAIHDSDRGEFLRDVSPAPPAGSSASDTGGRALPASAVWGTPDEPDLATSHGSRSGAQRSLVSARNPRQGPTACPVPARSRTRICRSPPDQPRPPTRRPGFRCLLVGQPLGLAAKRAVWKGRSHGGEEGIDRRQEQDPLQASP
jgi:hypothetical protein